MTQGCKNALKTSAAIDLKPEQIWHRAICDYLWSKK